MRPFPSQLCRAPQESPPPSAEMSYTLTPYSSSLLCMFCSFSKASFLSARGRTPETSPINQIVQKPATNGSGTSTTLITSGRYSWNGDVLLSPLLLDLNPVQSYPRGFSHCQAQ